MQNDDHETQPGGLLDWLEADTDDVLAGEILSCLHGMKTRLEAAKQQLHSRDTYETIVGGLGSIEAAESAMKMYIASKH